MERQHLNSIWLNDVRVLLNDALKYWGQLTEQEWSNKRNKQEHQQGSEHEHEREHQGEHEKLNDEKI